MNANHFRTTAFGTIVRLATKNRALAMRSYKDEYPKEAIDTSDDCVLVGW